MQKIFLVGISYMELILLSVVKEKKVFCTQLLV